MRTIWAIVAALVSMMVVSLMMCVVTIVRRPRQQRPQPHRTTTWDGACAQDRREYGEAWLNEGNVARLLTVIEAAHKLHCAKALAHNFMNRAVRDTWPLPFLCLRRIATACPPPDSFSEQRF